MTAEAVTSAPFRVLVLWDNDALLIPTVSFVRSVTGAESRLLLQPVSCGPADGRDEADIPRFDRDGVEVLARIGQVTDSVDEIIAIAAGRTADLIVMATTCCAVGALDPSCGAAALVLNSPIPVMLLRTHELEHARRSSIRRVVVPLDGSERAARSLPLAGTLARRLGVPARYVMVIDPARVVPPAYAYDPQAQDIITDLRATAHWALKQAEQSMENEGVTVNSSLLYGPVSTCIEAALEPDDVLVMTTHGTGRAAPSRLGSVAAKMVERVTTPLVITCVQPQRDIVVAGSVVCPWIEPIPRSSAPGRP